MPPGAGLISKEALDFTVSQSFRTGELVASPTGCGGASAIDDRAPVVENTISDEADDDDDVTEDGDIKALVSEDTCRPRTSVRAHAYLQLRESLDRKCRHTNVVHKLCNTKKPNYHHRSL